MKKVLGIFFLFLMVVGFANMGSAQQMQSGANAPMLYAEGELDIPQMGQMKIQGGEQIALQDGKTLRIEGQSNRLRLQVGNQSAECEEDCNMTQEQNRVRVTMSNGVNSEIKVMPDTASEKALERLRLKMCENCTLELKEVGEGNKTRMAYEMNAQKDSKFLGIFNSKMNVQAQVDAETGEVIKSKKPWWAFLASESDEAEQLEE